MSNYKRIWPQTLLLLLCGLTASAQGGTCGPDGAFGMAFGSKVPSRAKRVDGGKASIWYAVSPPLTHPALNLYLARVDAESGELFEVLASATVSPQHASPPDTFSEQERQAGRAAAVDAAQSIFASLPAEWRDRAVKDKYGAADWSIQVDQDTVLKVGTSIPTHMSNWAWSAYVSCLSIPREWAMARRVMPELFEREPKR